MRGRFYWTGNKKNYYTGEVLADESLTYSVDLADVKAVRDDHTTNTIRLYVTGDMKFDITEYEDVKTLRAIIETDELAAKFALAKEKNDVSGTPR